MVLSKFYKDSQFLDLDLKEGNEAEYKILRTKKSRLINKMNWEGTVFCMLKGYESKLKKRDNQ